MREFLKKSQFTTWFPRCFQSEGPFRFILALIFELPVGTLQAYLLEQIFRTVEFFPCDEIFRGAMALRYFRKMLQQQGPFRIMTITEKSLF